MNRRQARKQAFLLIFQYKFQPDEIDLLLENFFEENSFSLKIGNSISQTDLLNRLIKLGYKRSTMVSDIGEFSIRGDIADIYSLEENPIRLEFWGDEIVDIRFFDNETQKSIKKLTEPVYIRPLYKFILPDNCKIKL